MKRTEEWVSLSVPVDELLKMQNDGKPATAALCDIYVGGMIAMMRNMAQITDDEIEMEGAVAWFSNTIARYRFQRAIEWYRRCLTPDPIPHFNKLTAAEDERLAKLTEECAEVIQAVCKIQRHGYESYNPDAKGWLEQTNREHLQEEILDVIIAVARMSSNGDIQVKDADPAVADALRTSGRYMHHQGASDNGAA